jgi:hypothetical protein
MSTPLILNGELQVELTDHMVNSMEEIWEKDPELTFHQVKQYAENSFGRNGFKAAKRKKLRFFERIQSNSTKMITEYLSSLKFLEAFCWDFSLSSIFYFEEPHEFIFVV